MPRFTNTERLGVIEVARIVNNCFQWIFREQNVADMGIDAQIERVDDGLPSGKLIALQIKTGKSHFVEHDDYLIYYATDTHVQYWRGHSLPVILVAHLPEIEKTYWVHVGKSSVEPTKSAWRIVIPKVNIWGPESREKIAYIFDDIVTPRSQYNLSNIEWTPYFKIDISEFVPPIASHVSIQYRIWSDLDSVPLLIRAASEDGTGIMQEHSGPSGIINLMLTSTDHIYISLSHPYVSFQLQILGYTFDS